MNRCHWRRPWPAAGGLKHEVSRRSESGCAVAAYWKCPLLMLLLESPLHPPPGHQSAHAAELPDSSTGHANTGRYRLECIPE